MIAETVLAIGFAASVPISAELIQSDTVRGTYSVVFEGHSYSEEVYRFSDDVAEVCADLHMLDGEYASRWLRTADGWSYDAVLILDEEAGAGVRYGVRAAPDRVRWELEDGRVWIERTVPIDPSRPLLLFHSGIFTTFGFFVDHWLERAPPGEGSVSPQVIVADGGEIGDWTMEGDHEMDLLVISSEGMHNRLSIRRRGPPREVLVPEQEVRARSVADVARHDERIDRCLVRLDWRPVDAADGP